MSDAPTPTAPRARDVLVRYWRTAGVRWWHVAIPLGLTLLVAAAEGGSFALLIPLADGVGESGFAFLEGSRFFGWIPGLLPDAVASSPDRNAYLTLLLIGLIIVGRFLKLGFEYVRKVYVDVRNELYRVRVRQQTFGRVLQFGRQYFDRQTLGRIDTEVSWANAVVELLAAGEGLFLNVLRLSVKGALLLAISLPLSITFLVALPLIQVLLRSVERATLRISREAVAVEKRMRTEVLELLATIPLVKAYSLEKRATDAYGEILDESRDIDVRRKRLAHLKNPIEESVVLTSVLVAEGATLWITGDFGLGHLARFAAFLLVAQQCMPDYMAISLFRVKIYESLPKLDALAGLFCDEGKYMVPSGDRPFTGLEREIRIQGVRFGYRPDTPVLDGVDLTIPAGQVTALVGGSGAGKTTLVDLLARFYDCEPGTILVDGADIRDFSLDSLHERMAIVSQETWLLNRSLRDNLAFGLDDPPADEALLQALREVELGPLVESLEDGLDTEIGDRGVQLSGGQRQRIALAAALLRDPEILILDEATSALDSVVERKIGATLEHKVRGRTVIVIAHRLSTVRNADRIYVLEDGVVVESGRWEELIARGGAFAALHRAQYGAEPAEV